MRVGADPALILPPRGGFPEAPWEGMPTDFYTKDQKIDAARWRESNNKSYLFQGDQYIRLTGSDMDSGYARPIAGNWHGLPPEFEDAGIDAAFWQQSSFWRYPLWFCGRKVRALR